MKMEDSTDNNKLKRISEVEVEESIQLRHGFDLEEARLSVAEPPTQTV